MLDELGSFNTLSCVYAIVAFVSFLFALLSLVGSEVGDAVDFDVDTDVDTGVDFASISPFAIAIFGATFGLTGLITTIWLEMPAITSILVSTGVGIIFGGLAQVLFIYVFSPSKSSHFSLEDDAMGREAQVTVTIPADGLGQISYNNVSGRVRLGARSATGQVIPNGQFVLIEKIVGRAAMVRPLEKED